MRGDAKNPLSLNLYGYCEGNPVKYTDEEGKNPILLRAAVGFATGFGGEILGQVISGEKVNIKKALVSGGIGAITGALSFTGIAVNNKVADAAINFAGEFAGELISRKTKGEKLTRGDIKSSLQSAAISAAGSLLFDTGLDHIAKGKVVIKEEKADIKKVKVLTKEYKKSNRLVAKLDGKFGRKHAKKLISHNTASRNIRDYNQKVVYSYRRKKLINKASSVGRNALCSISVKTVKTLISKRPHVKSMSQYRYRR